jgi:hypothetical protein
LRGGHQGGDGRGATELLRALLLHLPLLLLHAQVVRLALLRRHEVEVRAALGRGPEERLRRCLLLLRRRVKPRK